MTSRKNHLTADEVEAAIHTVTLDDPLGRWGYRRVKHKLQLKGIPIPRYGIGILQATWLTFFFLSQGYGCSSPCRS